MNISNIEDSNPLLYFQVILPKVLIVISLRKSGFRPGDFYINHLSSTEHGTQQSLDDGFD